MSPNIGSDFPPGSCTWSVTTDQLPGGYGTWNVNRTVASDPVQNLLDRLASCGSDTDLACLLLMEEVKKVDADVNTKMQQIKELSAMRDAYDRRLNELRDIKQQIQRQGGDHPTLKRSQIHGDTKTVDYQMGGTGSVSSVDYKDESGCSWIGGTADADKDISVDDVALEEKRIEAQLSKLNSQNDVEMTKLNGLMNRKGQVTQLLSNIQKKDDDICRGLIANLHS